MPISLKKYWIIACSRDQIKKAFSLDLVANENHWLLILSANVWVRGKYIFFRKKAIKRNIFEKNPKMEDKNEKKNRREETKIN